MRFPLMLSLTVAGFLSLASASRADRIIRPNPDDYSSIQNFRAEWCAPALCYGRVDSNLGNVRSLLVRASSSLYVEAEPAPVELLKPRFAVVGPVNKNSGAEIGTATLSFDQNGEVEAAEISTPSLGTLRAERAL